MFDRRVEVASSGVNLSGGCQIFRRVQVSRRDRHVKSVRTVFREIQAKLQTNIGPPKRVVRRCELFRTIFQNAQIM